jgi:hypothetical protein
VTTIVQALSAVMSDVGAVRKGDRNQVQNFSFRGIDATVNACSPAFRKHGVVVIPELRDIVRSTVEVGTKRTLMTHVCVTVAYTFYGPEGDSVTAVVPGESFDSGDKCTAKSMSVAFRTALLQALALPTDEPTDPDEHSYERSPAREPEPQQDPEVAEMLSRIGMLGEATGVPRSVIASRFEEKHGHSIRQATVDQLERVLAELQNRAASSAQTALPDTTDNPNGGTE